MSEAVAELAIAGGEVRSAIAARLQNAGTDGPALYGRASVHPA